MQRQRFQNLKSKADGFLNLRPEKLKEITALEVRALVIELNDALLEIEKRNRKEPGESGGEIIYVPVDDDVFLLR